MQNDHKLKRIHANMVQNPTFVPKIYTVSVCVCVYIYTHNKYTHTQTKSFILDVINCLTALNITLKLLRSHFSFGFQSDRVFTCALNRFSKGINHPFQSGLNLVCIALIKALHEGVSVRLHRLFGCM